jgi:hypothetical protein
MESDGIYYFNRCRRCNRIITKLAILRAFEGRGEVCPCGSAMFGPTNPVGMEWLKPPALRMIGWQLLGLLTPAPKPEVVAPEPLKYQTVPALSTDEIRAPEEGEK